MHKFVENKRQFNYTYLQLASGGAYDICKQLDVLCVYVCQVFMQCECIFVCAYVH